LDGSPHGDGDQYGDDDESDNFEHGVWQTSRKVPDPLNPAGAFSGAGAGATKLRQGRLDQTGPVRVRSCDIIKWVHS